LLLHFLHFFLDGGDDLVVLLHLFEDVADVEESVVVQTDVHKSRLHAGKHACYAAFVDTAHERVFLFALDVNFN